MPGKKGWRAPLAERFWSKVDTGDPLECWEWQACFFKDGYGQIRIEGKNRRAHRVAYALEHGLNEMEILDLVLHACDNPACCNPRHLWLGSHADNARDMDEKGRRVVTRGEACTQAKLTENDVLAIRDDQRPYPEIAEGYGVSVPLICMVKRRKIWKHV